MTNPANAVIKLSSPETREFWQIPVLWEDPVLLALDKPSELTLSPDRGDLARPSLMTLLHRDIARGAAWARERGMAYLANAHRLDFQASGVVLLARNKAALTALANQFAAEKPTRTWIALAHGSPAADAFAIEAKLAPHPTRIGLMRVDPRQGKRARTHFEVVGRFSGYVLLNCRPLTARPQQIRAHARHAGFPLVGDPDYGGHPLLLSKLKAGYRLKPRQTERPLIGRVALHAERVDVIHPVTGVPVSVTAPWPKDFVVAIKYLRRYDASAVQ